jgi:Flp pilus assembly pilin Flp
LLPHDLPSGKNKFSYFQWLTKMSKENMNERKMSRFYQTAATIGGPYALKPERRLIGTEAETRRRGTVKPKLSNSSKGTTTMKLLNIFKHFAKDEDGAVTVDWVVLTAAIVGLGLVVMQTIRPGIQGAATAIDTSLDNAAAGTFGANN